MAESPHVGVTAGRKRARSIELRDMMHPSPPLWTGDHNDECEVCGRGGTLLCCDWCNTAWHLSCLDPPLAACPTGRYMCPICSDELEAAGTASRESETGSVRKNGGNQHLPIALRQLRAHNTRGKAELPVVRRPLPPMSRSADDLIAAFIESGEEFTLHFTASTGKVIVSKAIAVKIVASGSRAGHIEVNARPKGVHLPTP